VPGGEVFDLRLGGPGEEGADFSEEIQETHRIGPRRSANRRPVDQDDVVDLFEAGEGCVFARYVEKRGV